jgi:hypothetical protein
METVDALIKQLRSASTEQRAVIRGNLLDLAKGTNGGEVREHLERAAKGEVLEVQWELEEVIDAVTPKKPEPVAPEAPVEDPPPAPDAGKRLGPKDLVLVYDDPRGLMIHRTKPPPAGTKTPPPVRWFVTQVNPRTTQPETFELHPQEVEQLKTQLQGSPYWVLGAAAD